MGENMQKSSRACSGFAVKHIGTAYGGTATAAVAFTPIESFHTEQHVGHVQGLREHAGTQEYE
jgi:hypothetical protein